MRLVRPYINERYQLVVVESETHPRLADFVNGLIFGLILFPVVLML